MFSSVMSNDKEKYTKLCEKLDIKIPKDATDFQGKGMGNSFGLCLILVIPLVFVAKCTCFIFLLIVSISLLQLSSSASCRLGCPWVTHCCK